MELKPWEQAAKKQNEGLPPWEQAKQKGRQKVYSGSVLPLSRYDDGSVEFDSDAGLVGMAKEAVKGVGRAVTLPREVYDGTVDLNSDEATGRVLEAATVMSPINPGVRSGDKAIPGLSRNMQRAKPPVPTRKELVDEATGQYDAVRNSGVDYKPSAVADLAKSLRTELQQDGILDVKGGAEGTHQILGMLDNPPAGSVAVQIQHLEAARRAFAEIAEKSANATDRGAASRAVGRISEFIERADPASVVAGPAAEAGRTLGNARSNYAAGARSGEITGIEHAADLRAAAANSGQNVGNSERQRVASFLLNRDGRNTRGYTPEEITALEGVAEGSRTANFLRKGGNILGGGGGMATAVVGGVGGAAGAALGGMGGAALGGAIPPIVGASMKAGSNALTRSALRKVDTATRARSALMAERIRNAPMEVGPTKRKAALMRALLLAGQGGADEQMVQE